MPSPLRIAALVLLALLALWGLALGAESQREVFLEPDLLARDAANLGAAGNLVVLTAFPVALGLAGAFALLSRQPVWRRLGPAAVAFVATYGAILLGQSAWPNYVALPEQRLATLTISLLAANLRAVPSLALTPLCILVGVLLLVGWAGRRLLGQASQSQSNGTPEALLQGQTAVTLLAAPFLALAALGNIRLLLALPEDQRLGAYYFVLPAVALACLALAGLAVAKTWQLGTYVRNARLGAAVQEAWQTLGRIEAGVALLVAVLAFASSFLPAARLDLLALGRTFEVTLRGHTQLLLLLGIPLVPAWRHHRRVGRLLAGAPPHAPTLEAGTHPAATATLVASGATLALGIVATWTDAPVLWGWLLACLPSAIAASVWAGHRDSAPTLLLVAFLLWGIGNTIEATYDGGAESALRFRTSPGLLALVRTVAAVVAAVALGRLARLLGKPTLASAALAAGIGLSLGAVALLELPLTAWLTPRPALDAIAVGSLVASLDAPVRIALHSVAAFLAALAAVLVARLHRPDWFAGRPRFAVAVVRPKGRRDKTPA